MTDSTRGEAPPRAGHPEIEPVPAGVHRPTWSVMIPTYNCAEYLRETLRSVLAQDPGSDRMQIEVIDDVSTKDDPEAVVREIAPGRVSFYRQPENAGAAGNFTTCVRRSTGYRVHILHGDDAVRTGFYAKLGAVFDARPDIVAAFTRAIVFDEHSTWLAITRMHEKESGVPSDWPRRLLEGNKVYTPSIVVKRDAYEAVGGFQPDLFHSADWDMWKRVALYGPMYFETEPLALYREHPSSDTSGLRQSGRDVQCARNAIYLSRDYVPTGSSMEWFDQARRNLAKTAVRNADVMFRRGFVDGAMAQVREAFGTFRSRWVVNRGVRLYAKARWRKLRG